MNFTIRLPHKSVGKNQTVSDLIIFILSQEWPLSTRALHRRITKRKTVSFQAVHKATNQLLNQNVLIKKETAYKLNIEWLEQLIRFGHQTKQAYLNKEKYEEKISQLKKQWE